AGGYVWGQGVLGNQTTTAQALIVDKESQVANRGVYITGSITSVGTDPLVDYSMNFGGHSITPNNTATSPYAAKFSAATGIGSWAKIFNTEASAAGYVITVNENKELFAGGYAKLSIDLNGVIPTVVGSSGGEDGFIVKLNP